MTPEGAWFLQSIGSRFVSVYIMAGPSRTGKSTALNFAFPKSKFSVGSSVDACTKGIYVSQQYHELRDARRTVLLGMDTEGIGHVSADNKTDMAILTLSILIASVMSFNNKDNITRETIDALALAARLTDKLRMSSERKFADMTPEETRQTMPHLHFLVQSMVLEHKKKTFLEFVEEQVIPAGNANANVIRRMFPDRSAHRVSEPCMDRRNESRITKEFDRVTRPEYKRDLQRWWEAILKIHHPKMVKGSPVSGQTLLYLIQAYVDALNSERMPVIEDVWTMLRAVRLQDLSAAALTELRRRVDEQKLGHALVAEADLERQFAAITRSLAEWMQADKDTDAAEQDKLAGQWKLAYAQEWERILQMARHKLDVHFGTVIVPACEKVATQPDCTPEQLAEVLDRHKTHVCTLVGSNQQVSDAYWCRHMDVVQRAWYAMLCKRIDGERELAHQQVNECKVRWDTREAEWQRAAEAERQGHVEKLTLVEKELVVLKGDHVTTSSQLAKRVAELETLRAEHNKVLDDREAKLLRAQHELKTAEQRIVHERSGAARDLNEAKNELRRARELVDQNSRQCKDLMERMGGLQETVQKSEVQRSHLDDQLARVREEKARCEARLAGSETKLLTRTSECTEALAAFKKAETERDDLRLQLRKLQDQHTEARTALEGQTATLTRLRQEHDALVEQSTRDLTELRRERDTLRVQNTAIDEQRLHLEKQLEERDRYAEQRHEERERQMDHLHEELKRMVAVQHQCHTMEIDMASLRRQLEFKTTELTQLQLRQGSAIGSGSGSSSGSASVASPPSGYASGPGPPGRYGPAGSRSGK